MGKDYVPNNHSQESNTQAGDRSACVQVIQMLSTGLDTAAEKEQEGTKHNSESSSEIVASGTGEHGAKEGAACEEGYYGSAVCRQHGLVQGREKKMGSRTHFWAAVAWKSSAYEVLPTTPAMTPRS